MHTDYELLIDFLIKAEVAEQPRHELLVSAGPTPQSLLDIGFSALPMALTAKTVGKMFFDHCCTQRHIERIPMMLAGPQAIYRSATQPQSVVVVTFEMDQGYPLIIPVAKDRRLGRDLIANQITSMYRKEGPDPTPRWKRDGLLLWDSGR